MPDNDSARLSRALGLLPLPDARYLLPPISIPPAPPPVEPGPRRGIEFVVDIAGTVPRGLTSIRAALESSDRFRLGFPAIWLTGTNRSGVTRLVTPETAGDTSVSSFALAWNPAETLSPDLPAIASELAGHLTAADSIAHFLGWSATASETPVEAAQRALRLIALKDRFARSIEMRLLPIGRRFPTRDIFRSALALGLTLSSTDFFQWSGPPPNTAPLFTISPLGTSVGFLPERAAQGEAVAGLSMAFELPRSPAPLAVYDRMAVALDYLRQTLGGRPTAPDGAELDGERLWSDRDALTAAVREMEAAGIAPGSADAERFF